MNPKALIGALVGGLIGALVWFGISVATGMQFGYAAIGLGFLVGIGSKLMGGNGPGDGILAAIIAVLSIIAGSYMAVSHVISGELEEITSDLSQSDLDAAYDDYYGAALDYYGINHGSDTRVLAEIHEMDINEDGAIDDTEHAMFRDYYLPLIKAMGPKGLDLPQDEFETRFRLAYKNAIEFYVGSSDEVGFAANLSPMDFLFWGLGAFIAFGAANKGDEEEESFSPPPQRAARPAGAVQLPGARQPNAHGQMPPPAGHVQQPNMTAEGVDLNEVDEDLRDDFQ